MLGRLRCLVQPHRPDNRRVRKAASGDYYGYCAACGARIRRLKRGQWKRAWSSPATPAQG